jgi:hypothetical protein
LLRAGISHEMRGLGGRKFCSGEVIDEISNNAFADNRNRPKRVFSMFHSKKQE